MEGRELVQDHMCPKIPIPNAGSFSFFLPWLLLFHLAMFSFRFKPLILSTMATVEGRNRDGNKFDNFVSDAME